VTARARLRAAAACYCLSVATIIAGALVAAKSYPEPFDWTRMVISALASRKHNPDGSFWFAAALVIALALLWPVSSVVISERDEAHRGARRMSILLRVGLVCGMLVGAERLSFFQFTDFVRKGHEIVALAAFLAIYASVLDLELDHLRRRTAGRWMSILMLLPLAAIGVLQLALYLGQRHVGWLDHDWRKADLPIWGRFPFWQWLAAAALWAGMGHLLFLARQGSRPRKAIRAWHHSC